MTDAAEAPGDRRARDLERGLSLHRWLSFSLIGLLLIVNVLVGEGWWSFWPMMVLAVVYSIHMFVVRSLNVDEEWAEERADQLLDKSYDFGHMRDISGRVVRRDASVKTPEERE